MRASPRHYVNALVCAIVLAHAIYLFAAGRLETATALRTSLAIAQAVLGAIGVVWFLARARRPPS